MIEELILQQVAALPEHLKQEVLHFVEFLRTKAVPAAEVARPNRVAGLAAGRYVMAPDFNEPLDDFKEYM